MEYVCLILSGVMLKSLKICSFLKQCVTVISLWTDNGKDIFSEFHVIFFILLHLGSTKNFVLVTKLSQNLILGLMYWCKALDIIKSSAMSLPLLIPFCENGRHETNDYPWNLLTNVEPQMFTDFFLKKGTSLVIWYSNSAFCGIVLEKWRAVYTLIDLLYAYDLSSLTFSENGPTHYNCHS